MSVTPREDRARPVSRLRDRGALTERPARPPAASAPRSRHSDLDAFLELIYRHAGLRFPQHKLPLIERRATRALRENGQPSFSLGVAYLQTRPKGAVMQAVVNALTINETYFYRELDQMRLLCSELIPKLDRATGPVRILSLPCSTGEEPYSISIYCKENLPPDQAARVQVSGADIDSAAVDIAKTGTYRDRAVSRLPAPVLQRYFRHQSDGMYALDRAIVRRVTLSTANLLDPAVVRQFRMMDIVFCRNVLIYFDDAAKETALGHIHQMLRPNGCLLLAHAEQISRLNVSFEAQRIGGAQIHRRV